MYRRRAGLTPVIESMAVAAHGWRTSASWAEIAVRWTASFQSSSGEGSSNSRTTMSTIPFRMSSLFFT